jgi:hypothetical protein
VKLGKAKIGKVIAGCKSKLTNIKRFKILGKGAGILAQRGVLLEWAERAGRRYRESFWIAEACIGGLEHLVLNDTECQLIRKATYGGSLGSQSQKSLPFPK